MTFSTKSEYGLRALLNLAKNQDKKPCSLAKIAKAENISLAYLERLFAKLKKAGIIKSTKGAGGGYELVKKAGEISVREIFTALEGSLAPYRCVEFNTPCQQTNCPTKKVWQRLSQEINKTLEAIKLADLIE